MGSGPKDEDTYSEQEIARRRDEVVRRMLATPPQPHKSLKSAANTGKKKSPATKPGSKR